MMNKQHQNSKLEITIAAVIIATMLALSVVVLVTQEADAAMVCSCGIRIINAIINVIAAATAPSGSHTLTALEDLSSSDDSILD